MAGFTGYRAGPCISASLGTEKLPACTPHSWAAAFRGYPRGCVQFFEVGTKMTPMRDTDYCGSR